MVARSPRLALQVSLLALSTALYCTPACTPQSFAQVYDFKKATWDIKPVRVENELMQAPIASVLQDRHGFLWFSTQSGIYRYDGIFLDRNPFGNADTLNLRSLDFRTSAEDGDGALWFGTPTNGLYRYDPSSKTVVSFRHTPGDSTSISSDEIRSLFVDRAGTLWVGTRSGALDRFDPQTQQFHHYRFPHPVSGESFPILGIHDIQEDAAGNLWLATSGQGLLLFDRTTERFIDQSSALRHSRGSTLPRFMSLAYVSPDSIFVGTDAEGLFLFNPTRGTYQQIQEVSTGGETVELTQVYALYAAENEVWISNLASGLVLLDTRQEEFVQYRIDTGGSNPASKQIIALEKDDSGVLWVGTVNGLFKVVKNNFHSLPAIDIPTSNPENIEILSIVHDPSGSIWMGTDGHGIVSFDPSTSHYTQYYPDPGNPGSPSGSQAFAGVSNSKHLWFTTFRNGLNRMDLDTGSFTHFRHDPDAPNGLSTDNIWPVIQSVENDLWIGVGDGLGNIEHFNTKTGRVTHHRLPANDYMISSLLEDRNGVIWAGTLGGGLYILDPATGEVTSYQYDLADTTSISSNSIFSLFEDANHRIWIGTMDAGLNQFLPEKGMFLHYRMKDGLPSEQIVGIQEDDNGHLWLATDQGLSRFDPRENSFLNYDINDGLHGNEFRIGGQYERRGPYMFFGGLGGVTYFEPEAITANSYHPLVQLTGIQLFGQPVDLDTAPYLLDEITLKYSENVIDFFFASLDYKSPEKNRYQVKLEGWDYDWIDNGTSPSIRYRNLDPGTYVFRVRGSNSEGIWSEREATLRVTLIPPFYQQWWFIALGVLLPSGLALSFLMYRSAMRKETERIRFSIASDLHDEIGSNLSAIMYDCTALAEGADFNEEETRRIKTIQEALDETTSSLKEALWIINPKNEKGTDLLERMEYLAYLLLNDTPFVFSVDLDSKLKMNDLRKRHHILLAFKEILHNIHKHAKATHVDINVSKIRNMLVIHVKDNGVGFEKGSGQGIGMMSLDVRARESGGSVEIRSSPGEGTDVVFKASID